jgi:hypothetical protein
MENEIIGYKKPPRRTRFKPGKSGNPKGRPKRRQQSELEHIGAVVVSVMNEKVVVTDNGKKMCITKLELVLKRLLAAAANGKTAEIRMFINLVQRYGDKKGIEKYVEHSFNGDFSTALTAEQAWREAQKEPEE